MSTELVPSSQAGALITGIPGFTVPVTITDHDDKAAERNSWLTKLTKHS